MHRTYSVTKAHSYGINQTPRKTFVQCSCSTSTENSGQVLATKTNSGSERNRFLSNQNKIKPTVTNRVKIMEGEFTSSEQQNTGFQNRFGVVCLGTTTRWTWLYQERTKHINILELIARKLAILTFTKEKLVTEIHLQIDNMTANRIVNR